MKLLNAYMYYDQENSNEGNVQNLVGFLIEIFRFLFQYESKNLPVFKIDSECHLKLKEAVMKIYKQNPNVKIQLSLPLLISQRNSVLCVDTEFALTYFKKDYYFDLLKFKGEKIAKILTKISYFNYRNVKDNLYELNPTIKNKEAMAPNLFKIIDFSNKLSFFIIEEILSYDTPNKRAVIIQNLIEIAYELKRLNNLNDVLSVVSGLSNSIIQNKLTLTWRCVSNKHKMVLRDLKNFCTFEGCYKNFKICVENYIKNKIPFIPHIGIHLKYINFYEEKQKYTNKNGLICLEKIRINKGIISNFEKELKCLRKIDEETNVSSTENMELLTVFSNLNPKNEVKLEKIASLLEPKFVLYYKQEKSKRQTDTDKYMSMINHPKVSVYIKT